MSPGSSSLAAPARARPNPHLSDDERLARLVGRGDQDALGVLYERYHQGLFRYARSLLRDESDAADATQETFVKALKALRASQRDAPLRPWLFRIAHNESMTILRLRPRGPGAQDAAVEAVAVPDTSAADRARMSALLADLAHLTERQRSALVMRELNGLSHTEIGVTLSVTPNAAKQAIFEARSTLHAFAEGRRLGCERVRATIADGDRRRLRSKTMRAHLQACSECEAHRIATAPAPTGLRSLLAPFFWIAGKLGATVAVTAKPLALLAGLTGGLGLGSMVAPERPTRTPEAPARSAAETASPVTTSAAPRGDLQLSPPAAAMLPVAARSRPASKPTAAAPSRTPAAAGAVAGAFATSPVPITAPKPLAAVTPPVPELDSGGMPGPPVHARPERAPAREHGPAKPERAEPKPGPAGHGRPDDLPAPAQAPGPPEDRGRPDDAGPPDSRGPKG